MTTKLPGYMPDMSKLVTGDESELGHSEMHFTNRNGENKLDCFFL